MAWNDEPDRQERERRVTAAVARASSCQMSDAKWRKLLLALRELGVGRMAWKFIRDGKIYHEEPPPGWGLLDSRLGDFGIAPAVAYREIDWVEIPTGRATGVEEALAAIGQFPVRRSATGLRVVGYSWQGDQPSDDRDGGGSE